MRLPETVGLSVRAPFGLPFDLGGYHWGDDIVFDQATDVIDVDVGFGKAVKIIAQDVIKDGLIAKCGFKPRQIVLFGFGQGGFVALGVARSMDEELGGVISIGGALSSTEKASDTEKKVKTPVLVIKGRTKSALKDSDVQRVKDNFEFATLRETSKPGDNMPASREDMLPIMQFFGRRLLSMKGVPKGSIPLS
jgi:predicted esterase